MEAACRGASEAGGLTIGILPGEKRGAANPYVQLTIVSGVRLPFSIGRVRLDVAAKFPDGDHLWWFLDGNLCRAPRAFFEGRRELAFEGRAARIPAAAEDYLALIYGDWRTPRRDYVAHRDDGTALRGGAAGAGATGTSDDPRHGM